MPAYLGVVCAAADGASEAGRARRLISGAVLYVTGVAAVLVVPGVAAGVSGEVPLPRDALVRVGLGGSLVLIVALLADVRASWLRRLGMAAPLCLGALSAVSLAAFLAPFVESALALGADSGGVFGGGALLVAYAAGFGLPFVLVVVFVAMAHRAASAIAAHRASFIVATAAAVVVLMLLVIAGGYDAVNDWLARVLPFAST